VSLSLKVGCSYSVVGCDIALVFIFLCVGLMAIFFVVLRFSPVSFSVGVYFVIPQSWCGVSSDLTHATGCKQPRLRLSCFHLHYRNTGQLHVTLNDVTAIQICSSVKLV
jgi:hypothetical protein